MQTKRFYQSKTVIFNVLYLIVIIASAFGYQDFEPSTEIVGIATVIPIIVNIILRFITKKQIKI